MFRARCNRTWQRNSKSKVHLRFFVRIHFERTFVQQQDPVGDGQLRGTRNDRSVSKRSGPRFHRRDSMRFSFSAARWNDRFFQERKNRETWNCAWQGGGKEEFSGAENTFVWLAVGNRQPVFFDASPILPEIVWTALKTFFEILSDRAYSNLRYNFELLTPNGVYKIELSIGIPCPVRSQWIVNERCLTPNNFLFSWTNIYVQICLYIRKTQILVVEGFYKRGNSTCRVLWEHLNIFFSNDATKCSKRHLKDFWKLKCVS